jgi:hypothetical protein
VNQLEALEQQIKFAQRDGLNGDEIKKLNALQAKYVGDLLRLDVTKYYWNKIKENAPDRYRLRDEDRLN